MTVVTIKSLFLYFREKTLLFNRSFFFYLARGTISSLVEQVCWSVYHYLT